MPSTYSTLGHIELPAPGEQRDLWGAIINRSLTLIEDMIAGITEISTNGSATYIVSEVMGGADTSRNAILLCNGALIADLVVQVPNVSHIYHVRNQTTGGFVVKIKTQTGAALTVPQGYSALVHVDDPGNSDSVFFLTPPTTATTGMPLVSGATLADGDYGDIIASGSGTVLTIDSGAVSNGKLATMAATTLKGNATGGAASPTDLTVPDVKTLLAYTAADVGAQPADADLTTWAGLTPSANAQSLVTAADYAAMRALLDLEAGTDFLSPAAVSAAISAYAQPLDATLTALAAYSTNGLLAQTAADTFVGRTLTGAANEVSVANGDGVAGNPTVSLPAAMTFTGKTITGGTYTSPAAITGLPDPTSAQDAATKAYVDSVSAGLDVKASVRVASTANLTLSGEQTIDGILTSASRILVKNQSTASQNGIFVTAAGAWARATDMDNWSEVPGSFVFVEQGSTQADTGWVCTSDTGGTIGSTSMAWTQFAGAGAYTATGGVTLTGTQFSITTAGITDAMLRNSGALSVIGRSANSTGAPADISAASDGQALRRSGTTLGFGAIDLASANAITGDLPFANLTQGSARSVLGVTGNATADVASIQGTADQVLTVNGAGTALAFGTVATGGLTDGAVTYAKLQDASAGNVVLARAAATSGDYSEVALTASQLLGRGASGDIAAITLGTNLSMTGTTLNAAGGGGLSDGDYGDITVSGGGTAMAIDAGVVTYAKLQDASAGNVVLARAAATAGDYGEVALTASQLLGRGASGDIAAITLGTNLSMTGATLNAAGGGGGQSLGRIIAHINRMAWR